MSETPLNEGPSMDAQPASVPLEIPSAVSGPTAWPSWGLGIGLLTLIGIFVFLKGGRSAQTKNLTDAGMPEPLNVAVPALPASAPAGLAPVDTEPRNMGPSLHELRRTSPVMIYNNTETSPSSGVRPDGRASDLPMPPGFHPSLAESVRSGELGDREFIIAQGKLIDAVLETAINTDHPGMLRALVSTDIYGDTGRTVLLPRGSRLIGQYDSAVAQGQDRVFIVWQRVIRPDGIDVALDSGGTDALGQAGVKGKVNRHFFTMFGAATLLSIIGATAATVGVGPEDAANSIAAYRSSVAQSFDQAANSVMSVFVRIKPTIKVRPGMPVKVFVARDLHFDAARIAVTSVQVIP